MADTQTGTPPRRRFTYVELIVVGVIVAILVAIVVPVALDSDDSQRARDLAEIQEAIRRYQADTGAFPTFGPSPLPEETPSNPWVEGRLPQDDSTPPFAGIDFRATAAREAGTVQFSPDYIDEPPRHANEVAQDGTRRWRIDASGTVTVVMDERSY